MVTALRFQYHKPLHVPCSFKSETFCKAFRGDRKESSSRPIVASNRETAAELPEALYCKGCGRAVTAKDQAITVQSSFRHTFFNPAGIVFELGCYRQAPGCNPAGPPSTEFSWFAGYSWRLALCSGCQAHLGWCFESALARFWGLILNKLTE